MSSLAADLAAILAGVSRPGDFFVSGTADLRAPSLQVEGVGPVALPLAPPADWRRESTLTCRCAHCQELAGFLDDLARKGWVFKAAEALRSHVEQTIRKAGSDLDAATDQRSRPYSLVLRLRRIVPSGRNTSSWFCVPIQSLFDQNHPSCLDLSQAVLEGSGRQSSRGWPDGKPSGFVKCLAF